MVKLHPELVSSAATTDFQVWDANGRRWVIEPNTLPTVDGEPLLLVPTKWVNHKLAMAAGHYLTRTIFEQIQSEEATIDPLTGRAVHPTKENLARRAEFRRGRRTNIDQTLRILNDSELNLIWVYEQLVDHEWTPLDTNRLNHYLGKIRN